MYLDQLSVSLASTGAPNLVLVLYFLASYTLSGLGLLWIGRAGGFKRAWLAWIPVPVFRYYVMGKEMGSMNLFGRRIKRPQVLLAAVLGGAEIVLVAAGFAIFFALVLVAMSFTGFVGSMPTPGEPTPSEMILSSFNIYRVAIPIFILCELKVNYEFFRAFGRTRLRALLYAVFPFVGFFNVGRGARGERLYPQDASGTLPGRAAVLRICEYCGGATESRGDVCPACGAPLGMTTQSVRAASAPHTGVWAYTDAGPWAALAAGVLLALLTVYLFFLKAR